MDSFEIEKITRIVLDSLAKYDENTMTKSTGFKVPVGVSARHVHLTQADVETLFGKGYQLTKRKTSWADNSLQTSLLP
jgi:putative phosphotransacetylase